MNTRSTMQRKVDAYLAERRQAGFVLRVEGRQLARFARFTDASGHRGPLTIEIVSRWATASHFGHRITAARRIEVVRPFARYCRSWDGTSQIPPLRLFGPGHRRLTPHIYTPAELRLLMRCARHLPPKGGLRGCTCATVIGLAAASGLRLSEAVGLHRDDVDLEQGCLHIHRSKFGRSRLVPVHPTTARALRRYERRRDLDPLCTQSRRFFMFDDGKEATTKKLQYAFEILRQQLRHRPRGGHAHHRIHDLRHTFVCKRIERWYTEGVDIDRKLLALSTYVGHVSPADTYWYVTATPKLMSLAAGRLASLPTGGAS